MSLLNLANVLKQPQIEEPEDELMALARGIEDLAWKHPDHPNLWDTVRFIERRIVPDGQRDFSYVTTSEYHFPSKVPVGHPVPRRRAADLAAGYQMSFPNFSIQDDLVTVE